MQYRSTGMPLCKRQQLFQKSRMGGVVSACEPEPVPGRQLCSIVPALVDPARILRKTVHLNPLIVCERLHHLITIVGRSVVEIEQFKVPHRLIEDAANPLFEIPGIVIVRQNHRNARHTKASLTCRALLSLALSPLSPPFSK